MFFLYLHPLVFPFVSPTTAEHVPGDPGLGAARGTAQRLYEGDQQMVPCRAQLRPGGLADGWDGGWDGLRCGMGVSFIVF